MLLGKKVEVIGTKNIVQEGPNIIVGNHCGTFKDGAIIVKIVPRPIFFTANRMIFNKDELAVLVKEHFQLHLKSFGYFLHLALHPIISRLINFVSSALPKAGTIPVDLTMRKKLYTEENIPVAVTPLAFFGTQSPVFIPGKIKVNIGEPMYIADYMSDDFAASVEKFRAAMERRVKDLFMELIKA